MIGHPIKAFLEDTLKSGCLNVRIGRESFPIPISRSTNYLVEDPPTIEPIEEVMATSTLDAPNSDIEKDVKPITEGVIEEDEESDETFELPETKKPSQPPIELKPLPSGLRYIFLNSDIESSMIINDKLSVEETTKLIAILEKHQPVLG